MSGPLPGLAKLTRPRLFGAIRRERLFELLDQERERGALCVVGPAGAGKTTLVASYLDERNLPGIWYQIDSGDADLATFFYYLGLAAAPWQGARASLPLLTAEYAHDLAAFARRFFRELFSRLPAHAVLVLDNYQEMPSDSAFHEMISGAIDELPVSQTLFAISRVNPPSAYARLLANQKVALVEWDALKFTLDETSAVLAARNVGESGMLAARLHERSGGWAAALTLLIERGGEGAERIDGMERVFDYFAGQIFSRVEPAVQRFLVATALLPRLTADMAQALTGHPDAGRILESLYQRNLFTHRRPGREPTYQYHALFQAFLLDRAKNLLSESERRRLAVQAGGLLVSMSMPEDGFALFVDAHAWSAATDVICQYAPSLLAQGRGQTLHEWAARLPAEYSRRPWVSYWMGMAVLPARQDEARGYIEHAWHGFTEKHDQLGRMLAASAMIESYYRQWHQFLPMDRWIEELEELLMQQPSREQVSAQLRIHATLLLGILYRRPGHPSMSALAQKVFELLQSDCEINDRVVAGTLLLSYCSPVAELSLGAKVIQLIEPLAADKAVRPHHRYLWRARRAFFHYHEGKYDEGLKQIEAASGIAQAEGFTLHLNYMHYRMFNLCALDRTKEVAVQREAILARADPAKPQEDWHRWQVQLDDAVVRGDTAEADQIAARAKAAAESAGMLYLKLRASMAHAWLLALAGRQRELTNRLEAVKRDIAGTCFSYYESDIQMCIAWGCYSAGQRDAAEKALRAALGTAKRSNAIFAERWNARAFSTLLAEALLAGIETDYVRRVIRRYAVQAPLQDLEAWPWPVRVHTLGCFELLRDDEPVEFAGKAPKKVLSLLKAIIAFGGHHVPQQQIIDALWSQDEADLAQKSLGVALARLRKLLGSGEAVLLSDQRLSLNPQLCWIDSLALTRFIARSNDELKASTGPDLKQCAERALQLYRGAFLPDDLTESWTVQARERLRTRFTHFVERLAGRLEDTGQWHAALECYDRALDTDDLNEVFYRGEMRCYQALERTADALVVFRRLRQTLAATLGVKPSTESETLARTIAGSRSI